MNNYISPFKLGDFAAIACTEEVEIDGKWVKGDFVYIGEVVSVPGCLLEGMDTAAIVIAGGRHGSNLNGRSLLSADYTRFRVPTNEDWKAGEIW